MFYSFSPHSCAYQQHEAGIHSFALGKRLSSATLQTFTLFEMTGTPCIRRLLMGRQDPFHTLCVSGNFAMEFKGGRMLHCLCLFDFLPICLFALVQLIKNLKESDLIISFMLCTPTLT